MTTREHITMWPITDDSMRMSELIAQATETLPDILDHDHAVMLEQPTWSLSDDGRSLVARTKVNVLEFTGRALKAMQQHHARRLVDQRPDLSAQQIAEQTGVSSSWASNLLRAARQDMAA